VQVWVADYDDEAAPQAALAGVETLLLISSNEVGRRFPRHKNVIDAAKSAGVKHLVCTSAPKATASALILGPEHKATEEYLVGPGLAHTILSISHCPRQPLPVKRSMLRTSSLPAEGSNGIRRLLLSPGRAC
jgi:hypothetical protein